MRLETQVKNTIKKYKLCNKREKVLVALSGGKDSAVVAYLLKKFGYNIEAIYIDLKIGKYSENCLREVKKLCGELQIRLYVYDMKKEMGRTIKYFWVTTGKKHRLNNCAICGVFKKWILNKEARRLKADKITTGHNLDDEIQTFLMNIFKGSPKLSANSGPIIKNTKDKKFVSRIKPLFYVFEEDIKKYIQKKKLPFVEGKCPYAEDSYRIEVREFLNSLSGKDKENIIRNFEQLQNKMAKIRDDKMQYCRICGEPSRKNICKKCELMRI
jgi:uncharacterized protein (TIGR00269 family)